MNFRKLKEAITGDPDIDEYMKLLNIKYLEIQNKVLELIRSEKDKGATPETIEWKVLKLLRAFGVPIKKSDYKKKHAELFS